MAHCICYSSLQEDRTISRGGLTFYTLKLHYLASRNINPPCDLVTTSLGHAKLQLGSLKEQKILNQITLTPFCTIGKALVHKSLVITTIFFPFLNFHALTLDDLPKASNDFHSSHWFVQQFGKELHSGVLYMPSKLEVNPTIGL